MVAFPRGVNLRHTWRFSSSPTPLGIVNWAGDTPAACGPDVLGRSKRGKQGQLKCGEGLLSLFRLPESQPRNSQVLAV